MTTVTKGLVVDDPWIDLILAGSKTWEMRSARTSFRGWFGLIRKGSGAVWGIARLDDVGARMTPDELVTTIDKHRIPEDMIRSGAVVKWNTPWKLSNARRLERPVPYQHPYGAVTWVNLDFSVTESISVQLTGWNPPDEDAPTVRTPRSHPAPSASILKAAQPPGSSESKPHPLAFVREETASTMIGETEITQGNLTHSHFYMRAFLHRFPDDLIGGPNKTKPAPRTAIVYWGGPSPVETDIDGEKKFFRTRGWVRQFFAENGAEPGDKVRVEELAPYRYEIRLLKRGRV